MSKSIFKGSSALRRVAVVVIAVATVARFSSSAQALEDLETLTCGDSVGFTKLVIERLPWKAAGIHTLTFSQVDTIGTTTAELLCKSPDPTDPFTIDCGSPRTPRYVYGRKKVELFSVSLSHDVRAKKPVIRARIGADYTGSGEIPARFQASGAEYGMQEIAFSLVGCTSARVATHSTFVK